MSGPIQFGAAGCLLNKRALLSLYRFGSEIVGKLPARGDGLLGFVVKVLAMADSWEKVYGGRSSVYTDIFTRYDLREKTNAPFVRLFFGTSLAKMFAIRRHGVSEHLELIEAAAPDGERVFFQEHRYGKPEVSSEFFHTPSFNFAAAVDSLWAGYPHGLYLAVVPSQSGYGTDVTFCGLSGSSTECRSQKGEALVADVAARLLDGALTILLYGPPGTGKSTTAEAVAQACGGRLLKIDAVSMVRMGVQELGFILDSLRPRMLLIDDFDGAPLDEARARVLFIFERLKSAHAGLSVFVSVNDASKLDAALLRSGRIDEAIEIGLPDAEERADILNRLGVSRPGIVADTDGFNHADLAALARRAQREPMGKVLQSMNGLRALAEKAAGAATAETKSNPSA